jgi:uracil-DNA glycosylase
LDAVAERRAKHTVYPPADQVFKALQLTPLYAVKVVIVGQDPYHGPGQAHGLAFSVPEDVDVPPSLRNIFKEIAADVYDGDAPDFSPDLSRWAEQGVLLLNTFLTVEAGAPGSHAELGWQRLTDKIIETVSDTQENVVFLLWGKKAQAKRVLIDADPHLILEAPHPSPLSAWRGFLGCGHFSAANAYLERNGKSSIRW